MNLANILIWTIMIFAAAAAINALFFRIVADALFSLPGLIVVFFLVLVESLLIKV
ncbi:MAG: hypothetical protein HY394_05960 [Candidatus Diapherotrites archaeon]|nr:hypothetical protein [Candidatus Diapherotrites archaeon]